MSNKTMKVFNITDVETDTLKQHMASNSHIAVGRSMIAPGESTEVADDPTTRAHLEHYIKIGAVAVGKPPSEYMVAKDEQKKSKASSKEKPKTDDEVVTSADAAPSTSKESAKKKK